MLSDPMHYRQLGHTGLAVSVLGFGASPLGGVFGEVDEAEGIRAVRAALELGVNFFDVAPYYGTTRAESVLGRALRGVRREQFILATKVGQYGSGDFDFSAERVNRSIDESCARLGVDYLDLVQCHDIEFAPADQIVSETLPALARLRDAGRIGHIGITGLPLRIFPAVIDRAAPRTVEAALSFCRYGLNDTSLEALLPYFKSHGIGVINAAPTGMGLFTERGVPPWHPAPLELREGARRAVEHCRAAGVDIVKLALQFSLSHPGIASTLVGIASEAEIRCNVEYAEAAIDFEMITEVRNLLKPVREHRFTRGRAEFRDPVPA
jgi:L-galactose dehydrogenase